MICVFDKLYIYISTADYHYQNMFYKRLSWSPPQKKKLKPRTFQHFTTVQYAQLEGVGLIFWYLRAMPFAFAWPGRATWEAIVTATYGSHDKMPSMKHAHCTTSLFNHQSIVTKNTTILNNLMLKWSLPFPPHKRACSQKKTNLHELFQANPCSNQYQQYCLLL